MSNLLALTGREWKAVWYSPIAYVVGASFLLLQGWVFWLLVVVLNDPRVDPTWRMSQFFFGGTFFYWLSCLMLAPLLTMRTFSEEKRTGTIEVLLSAPVSDWQVAASKFLGAWLSYCALWGTTLVFFLILRLHTALDWGPVVSGYVGTWLLGAVLVSVGTLSSSLTRNQVIAAVVGFVLMLLLFSVGFLDAFVADQEARRTVEYLSLLDHFRDFARGVIDTRPVVFYLSVTAAALFLTIRTIAHPRWRAS
ncbi:MAG: ABC transporter permease subunit [Candidatus Omnitrophica bacterium]|nr:ABC transporter permease subunit [Candidatus Omnitrophota bacterium]